MKYISTTLLLVAAMLMLFSTMAFSQIPANDECGGAVAVTSLPFSYSQDTRLATPNATDPVLFCADSGGGKTVWFTFTPETTRIYTISTRNSTPTTYDIALGLFTGTCGSLVSVDCGDDIVPGTVRQAELTNLLDSGVTYIIHVAEWNGGGASGGVPTGGDLVLEVFPDTLKALYQGPRSGSVASGAIANTGAFMSIGPIASPEKQVIKNLPDVPLIQTKKGVVKPLGKAGSNIQWEEANGVSSISTPVVLENFQGMTSTGSIPPDPICAVGPNHVITMANSVFRIYTKDGTLEHSISLTTWFSNVRNPVGFSDPQVFYDHEASRWVMAGGGFAEPYSFLISVSDDDDPNGIWYNWSLPSGLGDSLTGALPDYPQMGFDEDAVYITSREFNPGFLYSRVRIIEKSQLYAGSAGAISWLDLWDLRDPDHRTITLDGIRPSMIFGHPGVHFLVNSAPYNPGTFITVWTLTDATTTPALTAVNIPVTEYYSAPNANQPGGSTYLFEAGGSAIRHKAVYRDSSLWVSHSIANEENSLYSALRYVRINPHENTTLEDAALAVDGYWHTYPALMVDANKSLIITFSRMSIFDYAGVYVSGRKEGDDPGLSPSVVVKAGEGHYEVVGGERNRWGDYSGAGLDPVDTLSVWVTSEYVRNTDDWAMWVGKIKMAPVLGKYIYGAPLSKNFNVQEVGTTSDPFEVMFQNFGSDPIEISGISEPSPHFALQNLPSFPYTLNPGDTLFFDILHSPQDTGEHTTTVEVINDDVDRSPVSINVSGTGFHIIPVTTGTFYSTTGTSDVGKVYNVSSSTGSMSLIGSSGYTSIVSLRVHPTTNELVGLASYGGGFYLTRINVEEADAHPVSLVDLPLLKGMAFIDDTSLYVGRINGRLYRVNYLTGSATEVASTGLVIAGLAINPITGQLWASLRTSTNTDRIYKINMPAGTTTLVGATGFNQQTQDIIFDANGNLFGVIGSGSQTNRLIHIDTLTGAGTVIGSMGRTNVQSLAFDNSVQFNTYTFRHLKSNWNMVSLPVDVSNNAVGDVFPSPSSEAFSFNGNYQSNATVVPGTGYWVKLPSGKVHMIFGDPITEDTISVRERWNMISSVSNDISTSNVIPVPPVDIISSFYGFDSDTGYSISTTIKAGRSYWVKTDTSGELTLNSVLASKSGIASDEVNLLSGMNKINVQDRTNHAQILYFGPQSEQSKNLQRFELPPAPPEGMFDARFTTNSIAAFYPADGEATDLAMNIRAKEYPVTIQWNCTNDSRVKYSIVVKNENSEQATVTTMNGSGKLVINDASSSVKIRVEQNTLPTAFALKQNYPNPFNPTTAIRYEMPVDAFVRLSVFDILGREVATLVNGEQKAGSYDVTLDASNFASGVYFYHLSAEPGSDARGFSRFQSLNKMVLIK